MLSVASNIDPNQVTRGLRVTLETAPLSTLDTQFNPPSIEKPKLKQLCKADLTRDDLTGLMLGSYALGAKIGAGGMGKVFLAKHVALEKRFAIKFITTFANVGPELQLRFEQEVKALGKLQHPNIVNAVDAGCLHGMHYLVTELVAGADLAQLVQRRGVIPIAEACEMIRQIALGLGFSHKAGCLHRDIKPSNMILDHSGWMKLLDFGLACSTNAEHNLTVEGEMLGTWDYVAPEQAQDARRVDHRSDIYALGCTLLFLLSGQPPYSNARYSTVAAKLKGHLFDQPSWLDHPPDHVPPKLVKVLAGMLAKQPSQRFSSAEEVASALLPFTQNANLTALFNTPTTIDQNAGIVAPTRNRRLPFFVGIGVAITVVGSMVTYHSFTTTSKHKLPPSERVAVEPISPTTVFEPISETLPTSPDKSPNLLSSRNPASELVTSEAKQTSNAAAIRFKVPITSSSALQVKPLGQISN